LDPRAFHVIFLDKAHAFWEYVEGKEILNNFFAFPCEVAPPGAETTMTTLAFVIFDGLGCSIGGSVSGLLYKTSKIFI
jgi:hypothetical protein